MTGGVAAALSGTGGGLGQTKTKIKKDEYSILVGIQTAQNIAPILI